MDWITILFETFNESFSTLLKLAYIVIPLLILIECLKDAGWLEKVSAYCRSVTKFFKLPGESAIGLTVGFFIGLLFGSGVILQIKEDVKMTKTQINTMFLFVGICHSIIEETVLFTAIGAYGGILVSSRILAAVIFSIVYIRVTEWLPWFRDEGIIEKAEV